MSVVGGAQGAGQDLSVIPDEVRAVGRSVAGLAASLRSALDSVGVEVEGLASGAWSGAAATAFAQGWRETQSSGGAIIDVLTKMAEKLGVAAQAYEVQDTDNAAQTSSLSLP
ncbi:WXG100 family type VII secretion target [Nocardia amikacinitolerans]|uniref:WXG100 family type VII secretion target n=1 Tax=Nocardia amikacinitolerans TaxID=756689 RepID=A0A285L8Y8_9NOCA|nr:WXG100 family type VII secretion target [Nocardia amikacinitolerans]SNY81362.1 WXG100 family type VII secretion target [Nocardia amikacinitolerans]